MRFSKLYTSLGAGTIWTGLGIKRGADLYDSQHTYSQHTDSQHTDSQDTDSQHIKNYKYLYSDKMMYCLYGAVIYINPLFFMFTLHKELYRLEVKVRQLEKDDDYYQLL